MALETVSAPIRAAQYVRMSTDHQQYSTTNQSDAIRAYAAKRGMEVIRTYADEGKSGVTFDRRDALKQLIDHVQAGKADFKVILVYDVSRWGRFQDPDEAAYHEHVCKRAGITVHYCAEQFENDGSSFATIVKNIKRTMAGEFSRELSAKTFAGQCRVVELGYRVGGLAGYGLRRMLVDQNGAPKGILARGEWKCIATDRSILVPGPPAEVETVRWIYSTFVRSRKTEFQIATTLNRRGILNDYRRSWNRHTIKFILKNEKYIGNNVWNHESFKLQKVHVRNSPEMWLRADGAFEPIVDRLLFDAVQAIFRARLNHPIVGRGRIYSDEKMLETLRRLLRHRGYLTSKAINESDGIQSASAYIARFGSLSGAYQLIGYNPDHKRRRVRPHKGPRLSDEEMLEALCALLRDRGYLDQSLIDETTYIPASTTYVTRFGGLKRAYQLINYTPDFHRKRSPRPRGLSSEEMLDALRALLRERGHLSQEIIDGCMTIPACYQYWKRFGGLTQAFKMIGFISKRHRS